MSYLEVLARANEALSSHGVDLLGRKLTIMGQIEEGMPTYIFNALSVLESLSSDPIEIHICSPGGSVDEGLAIADRIKTSPCHTIGYGYGIIASIAVPIFAACNERKCGITTRFMVHSIFASIDGKIREHRAILQELSKQSEVYTRFLEVQTGTKSDVWAEMMNANTDVYFSPIAAKEYNLVTEIITKREHDAQKTRQEPGRKTKGKSKRAGKGKQKSIKKTKAIGKKRTRLSGFQVKPFRR